VPSSEYRLTRVVVAVIKDVRFGTDIKSYPTIVLLLGLLIGICILLKAFEPSEPSARGQSLSVWVGRPGAPDFKSAINEMGAHKVVPAILRDVRNAQSWSSQTYEGIWVRLPSPVRRLVRPPKSYDELALRNTIAVLGPAAVPVLVPAFRDRHRAIRKFAVDSIFFIAVFSPEEIDPLSGRPRVSPEMEAAIPQLVTLLADSSAEVRAAAVMAVAAIEPAREKAVAQLIELLNGPSNSAELKASACGVLGRVGVSAKEAAPILAGCLRSTNAALRVEAAVAVWRTQAQTNVLPLLTRELETSHDEMICSRILGFLAQIGPAAEMAAPALMNAVTNRQFWWYTNTNSSAQTLSTAAANALRRITNQPGGRL
jgi:HEAT repeat protein